VFIVSSKKVKYTIFLVDGITSELHVGESYTVTLSCGANPMMILNGPEGHATGSFYVLEQEAFATHGLLENALPAKTATLSANSAYCRCDQRGCAGQALEQTQRLRFL
jgi:hypothetical protein